MEKKNETAKKLAIATIKGGVGAIPFIGSLLNEYVSIYQDKRVEQEWATRLSDYESSLKALHDQVTELLRLIPPEKIIIPSFNVIGAAIESAKYQIEDEHLRNMFANLIVGSMNKDTISLTHPAFIDIIKQLSPFDALFLTQVSDTTVRNKFVKGTIDDGLGYVVAQLRHYKKLQASLPLLPMEYQFTKQTLKDFMFQNFDGSIDAYKELLESATVSLDNLERLNLVIVREKYAKDTPHHKDFAKSNYMKDFVESVKDIVDKSQNDEHFESKVGYQWYSVKLTEFGISFCDIVLKKPDYADEKELKDDNRLNNSKIHSNE
ncbi:MAG: DUF4393 domain-containing protein [Defluviitaleaceae bacterium]|nr:DUF4393 domain-containing protein [Defluviitaleaceae bacterium]